MSRQLGLAAVALVFAAAAVAARAVDRPDPLSQAALDGCGRSIADVFQHLSPNWAYVNDGTMAADGPPPPPQQMSGVVSTARGADLQAHPAGIDSPFTHLSYDFVFNVEPDEQYAFLLGGDPNSRTGNFSAGEQVDRLHIERESRFFPPFAWPEAGDRVTIVGSWVWDCDHSDRGERTELHPFRVIWLERSPGGSSPLSPYGEAEGDLYVSTVGTPAGTQADCAHRTKGDRASFKACLASDAGWQDPSGDYTFALRAPPRPSAAASLRVRVLDAGSTAGAPQVRSQVSAAGAIVTLRVRARPNERLVVAKRVLVGWTPMPASRLPLHLRVGTRELLVRRALDPTSLRPGQNTTAPGEWLVYLDAGGVWLPALPPAIPARDGQRIRFQRQLDLYVPRRVPWRFLAFARECDDGSLGNAVSPTGTVWPCPRNDEAPGGTSDEGGDDVPGIAVARFRSPTAGLGSHRTNARLAGSTCPPAVKLGCYRLSYTVLRVRDEAARARRAR